MRKFLMCAAVFGLSASATARAGDPIKLTLGNDLFEMCQEDASSYKQGLCDGYITGVAAVGQNDGTICLPPHTIVQQIYDVVTYGLRNHPEERQRPSQVLVLKYLHAAFKCR
jgi:hypothetical protein